jgi:CRP-like cAMP-binding protein
MAGMRSTSPPAVGEAAQDALRACPLFAGVSEEGIVAVAMVLRPRRYRRGETIFHAGDPGDALFLVTSGEVKITIPSD